MTPAATTTACQASRRRARTVRPLVSARNSGIVPIGSMITTRVTNTSVNSFTSNGEWCMARRGYRRAHSARLSPFESGRLGQRSQPGRQRAERELGLDVAVTQIAEADGVVEQQPGGRGPDQRPQPQPLRLADEH